MSELIPIANSEDESRAGDIVFVHGLDGDGRATWHPPGKPECSWPWWISEEFPDFGVWSLDYDSASLGWMGTGMPLLSRAGHCLELFDIHDVGKRPLIFITHSLGGLLAKQMLRHANDTDRDWVVCSTRGIVFLATPHTGSSVATWVDRFGNYLPLRSTEILKNLRDNDPALIDLNQWYRNHVVRFGIETKSFYEESKTKGVVVVDRAASDPGIPGVDPIAVDADHISICKPTSKGSFVFKAVSCFLRDSMRDSVVSSKSVLSTTRVEDQFTLPGSRRFQVFGTLPHNAATYVVRRSDNLLQQLVKNNVFIALQGPHQIGKSSLLEQHPVWLHGNWTVIKPSFEFYQGSTVVKFEKTFFQELQEIDGRFSDWIELSKIVSQQKVAFLLDELGCCHPNVARELVKRLYKLGADNQQQVRVIVTSHIEIASYISEIGLTNPRYSMNWQTVGLAPFSREEAMQLIHEFPEPLLSLLNNRIVELERLTQMKPNSLQRLCEYIWKYFQNSPVAVAVLDEKLTGCLNTYT